MHKLWIAFKRCWAAALLVAAASGAWGAPAPVIPAPQGFVNDFAGVLAPDEKNTLTSISETLQAATGAEMVFVTVATIAPYDDMTYGMAVFDQWKIGQKRKDNGLLVLLAIQEHRIRIITGYGLEAVLPDGKLGRFRDEYLIPFLKQGKTGEGLINLGQRLAQEMASAEGVTLSGAAGQTPHRRKANDHAMRDLIVLLVFLLITGWASWLNRRRGGRGGGFFYGGGSTFSSGGGGFGGGFGGFGGGFSGGGGVGGSW